MNLNEAHVHHMAKRLHQAHSKLDALTAKGRAFAGRFVSTLEVSGGAFLGGVLEGKTDGGTLPVVHVPINLLIGAGFLAAGHLGLANDWSEDLNNVGNGLVAGYVASKGYAFGKRWHDGGFKSAFGGAAAPQLPAPVAVQGDISPAQLQAMVDRMNAAAGQPQAAR